jgi:hypothetical protein
LSDVADVQRRGERPGFDANQWLFEEEQRLLAEDNYLRQMQGRSDYKLELTDEDRYRLQTRLDLTQQRVAGRRGGVYREDPSPEEIESLSQWADQVGLSGAAQLPWFPHRAFVRAALGRNIWLADSSSDGEGGSESTGSTPGPGSAGRSGAAGRDRGPAAAKGWASSRGGGRRVPDHTDQDDSEIHSLSDWADSVGVTDLYDGSWFPHRAFVRGALGSNIWGHEQHEKPSASESAPTEQEPLAPSPLPETGREAQGVARHDKLAANAIDLDSLVEGIYPRLRRRLRQELSIDRERAGMLADFR